MVSFELLSMAAFFAIVSILLYRDRKNVEFTYGIIIKRWSKGKELIDRLVNKRRRLVAYIGTSGVIAGLIAALVGMYFLVSCAFFPQLLPKSAVQEKCFKLVLPSVSGAEKYYPEQVMGIPFWYWLTSIFIIILVHESMHAVFARLDKVPIKSYGLLFLLALPIGAFVDPDNKKLNKLSTFKKLRIYAGGSLGNFILALFVVGLIIGTNSVTSAFFDEGGVRVNSTVYNMPAYNVSLSGVIVRINDAEVKNVINLANAFTEVEPGDTITIQTTKNIYSLRTISHPENSTRAYVGITGLSTAYQYKMLFDGYASDLTIDTIVSWQLFTMILFILSLGVGIANMLPLKPFDGGLFFEEILVKYFGKKAGKKMILASSLIILALIVVNLLFAPVKLF